MEILQYKLLNNPADSFKNEGPEASFKELMNLCRGDLTEIKSKVGNIATHANVEDKLRKEIIEQGKKMNELRAEHERQVYEEKSQSGHKIEQL